MAQTSSNADISRGDRDELDTVVDFDDDVRPTFDQFKAMKSVRLNKLRHRKEVEELFKKIKPWVTVTILEVNTLQSRFTCDLEFEMRYHDPQIRVPADVPEYDGFVAVDESELLQLNLKPPRTMLENAEDVKLTFFNLEVNFKTKEVFLQYNYIAVYSEIFELRRFPFDRQLLHVYIEVADVEVLPPEDWGSLREDPFSVSQKISDFSFMGYRGQWKVSTDPAFEAQLELVVELERRPFFYAVNYGLIIFLVVTLNSATFAFESFDERMAYSASLFLTLVAFKFVIMQSVPVVNYLTFLDRYVVASFFYLFIGSALNVFVSAKFTSLFKDEELRQDDLNEVGNVDEKIQFLLLVVWVGIHALLYGLYLCGFVSKEWERVYREEDEWLRFAKKILKKKHEQDELKVLLWERSVRLDQ